MKAVIFGSLAATILCGGAHAAVDRTGRVAVVVIELATHAASDKKQVYDLIEAAGLAETKNRIKPMYRKVVVLNGAQATSKNFFAALKAEVASVETMAIDTYINVHGNEGALTFYEGAISMKDVRAAVTAIAGSATKLRALNSTACYGATHTGDWLAAGFKVASGARRVNANGAHDLPTFLKAWGGGETYSQAQDKGNDSRWIKIYDALAVKWGMNDVDSYKVVEGKSDYTISTDVAL